MQLKRLTTGMYSSNCYILGDNGHGAVIDPGAPHDEIVMAARKLGLGIDLILITHAHIDHITTMDELRQTTRAKVMIHKADASALPNPWYNGSALFGVSKAFKEADALLNDGDVLDVGGVRLEIIHTPGHTPGGISIKAENAVFTGDTLFRMSIGRVDLGNGDYSAIIKSIRTRLLSLDDKTVVYPGHGTSSTIGYERHNNPYV